MGFVKEKVKDFYLLDTKVENIFINEYMPIAPGDYVKVYLYAYMYAEHNMPMDNKTLATQLSLTESDVEKAWNFWEEMGTIKRTYLDDLSKGDCMYEFANIKERMYGKSSSSVKTVPKDTSSTERVLGDRDIKNMLHSIDELLGRALNSTEITKIIGWNKEMGATPEAILFAVQYAKEKNNYSLNYIEAIVRNWTKEGLKTVDQIKEKLQEDDMKYYNYRRVMKALGFPRNATEAEEKIIGCWFDELGFNMDKVLEACDKTSGIANPNINYVNKVLLNWKKDAEEKAVSPENVDINAPVIVTRAILNQYLSFLRSKAESEAEERKTKIYEEMPRIMEIDDELGRAGFELSKAMLGGKTEAEIGQLKANMDNLSVERAILLTDNNYEIDYTDIKYACDICKDTGLTDEGERCNCIAERTKEAEIWAKQKDMKK